ncbi:glucokinase [Oxalobacteraceae bacterium GrIS 2.11]
MIQEHPYPHLLADVGGTNIRFALVLNAEGAIVEERSFVCNDYSGLYEAIRSYLAMINVRPGSACIGIAAPVSDNLVSMTCLNWQFSQIELKEKLGLESLIVVNDFTALALSVPGLTDSELNKVGGKVRKDDLPIAIIGAGTGLGVSGLIPMHRTGAIPHWIPLQGEGGHVSFTPFNEREDAILRVLRNRFGHVSAERALSGPGLFNIFDAISTIDSLPRVSIEPAEIIQKGLQNACSICRETLDTFCAILGTTAANLTITLGARGGLYIGGGIVPRFGEYFSASPFRSRFEHKGRISNYLADVPVFVIHAQNPALRGAAAVLKNQID